LFVRFLRDCFGIPDEDLAVYVYTGNGLTIREIEDRWLDALDLPRAALRKHSINKRPAPTSGVKKNKLPYGVARLDVARSTWLVQHIYGAIQEYGDFDEPQWLDGRTRTLTARQPLRWTCEPPTIASVPSANRTQALLPPS
jgi:hypothetical protein